MAVLAQVCVRNSVCLVQAARMVEGKRKMASAAMDVHPHFPVATLGAEEVPKAAPAPAPAPAPPEGERPATAP